MLGEEIAGDIEKVRWHEGAREYLVRMQGGSNELRWVDEEALPPASVAIFDREWMLEQEDTDHSDSDNDEDSGVGGEGVGARAKRVQAEEVAVESPSKRMCARPGGIGAS